MLYQGLVIKSNDDGGDALWRIIALYEHTLVVQQLFGTYTDVISYTDVRPCFTPPPNTWWVKG